jgi:oxygen-independent coproporphyrinogen-3 oxidase
MARGLMNVNFPAAQTRYLLSAMTEHIHDPSLNDTILRFNAKTPRYTSYPTAPHFRADVTFTDYTHWLQALPEEATLSLYLHIPFCAQMCWYCGCHTKATRRYEPVERYLELLLQEIRMMSRLCVRRHRVTHVHFGGGSPTILKPEDFSRLMQALREAFDLDPGAEIAIEIDPRNVSEAKIAAWAQGGVNRASIGVQDFHEEVQDAINRKQPFRTVWQTVELLRGYGIDRINMDLMYGLPHQSVAQVAENISRALLMQPDRIAFFGYAHVPWMKKHMRLIDEQALPDGRQRLEMFQAADRLLSDEGYVPVGLDHFVRHGDSMLHAQQTATLRRNFQGYTTDDADALIGFGLSSISRLPQGYVQNTLHRDAYEQALAAGHPATVKGICLNADDHLRHALIERLMCDLEVDVAEVCARHAQGPLAFMLVLSQLQPLQEEGLVRVQGTTIRVHPQARQLVRYVCSLFDRYYLPETGRHTQVA